ncbi:MAG: hypothetical protein ACYCXE_07505 [Thermoleophilia bacterium]
MSSSKLTIIGVAAVALLLLGAAVVFAQGNTGTYGPGMMRGFGASGTTGTAQTAPNTPPSGGYGPGMMGNVDWNKMRHAMNSGNWNEMYQVCRGYQ